MLKEFKRQWGWMRAMSGAQGKGSEALSIAAEVATLLFVVAVFGFLFLFVL